MATEPTLVEQKTTQLKQEVDLLTQQVEFLKAQSALSIAQVEQSFSELQGIKAGSRGLTLPTGKEGTVKVAVGTQGTALLRSKRAMLKLLDTIADDLIKICSADTTVLTEDQLGQASSALFTFQRIENENSILDNITKKANPQVVKVPEVKFIAPVIAGAYTVGISLETINSLAKLMRTNRQFDVFDADKEAIQMLGYLLESKDKRFIAKPDLWGDNAVIEAGKLLEQLNKIEMKLQMAKDILAKIQKYSDKIDKASVNNPIRKQVKMPSEEDISALKAEIDNATSLLEGLHPSKKQEAFWTQVKGQVLAANIQNKSRLLIEANAQTVQVTESRWYASDRILATGEVQVAYRLLKPDGSLEKAGIILKASEANKTRIDDLDDLNWQRP